MAAKKNTELFKDRITKSSRKEMTKALITAINTGNEAVHKLLFGSTDIDEYSNHGKYKKGMHEYCSKLSGDSFTEKRLCRCMYYKNSNHETECELCGYRERFKVTGDYQIIDYEVPAFYYGDGIGEIDLVISDGKKPEYYSYTGEFRNNYGVPVTVTLLDAEGVSLSSWSLTDGQSINISAKDIATSTGTIRITGDGVSEDRAVSFTKQ